MARDMEWRPVPGFEMYEVSEFGDVRRVIAGRAAPPGIRRTIKNRCYRAIVLYGGPGRSKAFAVHRLVLLAFVGPPPSPSHVAAHNDGDGSNNHVSNLRWATPKENCDDRRKHGRQGMAAAVLTSSDVKEIRAAYANQRARRGLRLELSRRFGVGPEAISAAATGRTFSELR